MSVSGSTDALQRFAHAVRASLLRNPRRKARIERQRQLMQRLGMAGHDTEAALVVLKALEGALEAMHAHRACIKGSIERLKHAA